MSRRDFQPGQHLPRLSLYGEAEQEEVLEALLQRLGMSVEDIFRPYRAVFRSEDKRNPLVSPVPGNAFGTEILAVSLRLMFSSSSVTFPDRRSVLLCRSTSIMRSR